LKRADNLAPSPLACQCASTCVPALRGAAGDRWPNIANYALRVSSATITPLRDRWMLIWGPSPNIASSLM